MVNRLHRHGSHSSRTQSYDYGGGSSTARQPKGRRLEDKNDEQDTTLHFSPRSLYFQYITAAPYVPVRRGGRHGYEAYSALGATVVSARHSGDVGACTPNSRRRIVHHGDGDDIFTSHWRHFYQRSVEYEAVPDEVFERSIDERRDDAPRYPVRESGQGHNRYQPASPPSDGEAARRQRYREEIHGLNGVDSEIDRDQPRKIDRQGRDKIGDDHVSPVRGHSPPPFRPDVRRHRREASKNIGNFGERITITHPPPIVRMDESWRQTEPTGLERDESSIWRNRWDGRYGYREQIDGRDMMDESGKEGAYHGRWPDCVSSGGHPCLLASADVGMA